MKVHNVKLWSEYFDAVLSGAKPFEVRKNDRDYRTGDLLVLWDWDRKKRRATGSRFVAKVGYLLPGSFGLKKGYCVFGLVKPTFDELKRAACSAVEPIAKERHLFHAGRCKDVTWDWSCRCGRAGGIGAASRAAAMKSYRLHLAQLRRRE